ncbi:MAG: Nif3-like dinuclear metal center hexameric protein [Ruminococcaceae bacterium]|nr:Nif3-like dinuclear metal center hexameric protein [Oscillospiraceae bacterium]
MNFREFYEKLEKRFPSEFSATWDNDGVMVCTEPERQIKKCLTCLDITLPAVEYAAKNGFDVIISHHPLIFRGLKSIDTTGLCEKNERAVLLLIKSGIAAVSFHTRLDAMPGGLNDYICKLLELDNVYVCQNDEFPLMRVGKTGRTYTSDEFARHCSDVLELGKYSEACALYGDQKEIRTVALVTGSGGDYIKSAVKCGADLFVSGDVSYHETEEALLCGINVIDAGHSGTERAAAKLLKEKLDIIFNEDIYSEFFIEKRKCKYFF